MNCGRRWRPPTVGGPALRRSSGGRGEKKMSQLLPGLLYVSFLFRTTIKRTEDGSYFRQNRECRDRSVAQSSGERGWGSPRSSTTAARIAITTEVGTLNSQEERLQSGGLPRKITTEVGTLNMGGLLRCGDGDF
jgi:hypothetical protein